MYRPSTPASKEMKTVSSNVSRRRSSNGMEMSSRCWPGVLLVPRSLVDVVARGQCPQYSVDAGFRHLHLSAYVREADVTSCPRDNLEDIERSKYGGHSTRVLHGGDCPSPTTLSLGS